MYREVDIFVYVLLLEFEPADYRLASAGEAGHRAKGDHTIYIYTSIYMYREIDL